MTGKYTLDDLMRVTGDSEIVVRGRKLHVYYRTLGHSEADARQNYASARARSVMRELKKDDSPAYREYLSELDEVDGKELLDAVVTLHTQLRLNKEAQKEIQPVDEPEPLDDDPTLVETLEVEETATQIAEEVSKERQSWLEKAQEEYREGLKNVSREELVKIARQYRAEQITNAEYMQGYQDATLYYGVFTDAKCHKRRFTSPEQTRECDEAFRMQLLAGYYTVDAFSAEVDELKN